MSQRTVGVIGGSGLYEMAGLPDHTEHEVTTTFGDPSDSIIGGTIGETRYLFLPRHGRGHRVAPHQVNYRANILALKQLGAEQIISVSAVGSMREDVHPGDVVLVDQFIDRTRSRPGTFFEDVGCVAHVGMADPICASLQSALHEAAKEVGARVHKGGTYICIEGPQFSTRAESDVYRSWGATVIGMTNMPEARLAREAELPYATMALVTDYDCWRREEESVTVEAVIAVLKNNVRIAQEILRAVSVRIPDPRQSPASTALQNAIITAPERIDARAKTKLAAIIGRYVS